MKRQIIAIVATVGLAVSLTACATGPSYPKDVVEGYFGAINAVSPEEKLGAQKYAAPGSNADAYAIEQSASNQALMDGGMLDQTESIAVYEQDQVLLCPKGYEQLEIEPKDVCAIYSDFVFDGDKLADFSAGGEPLEGRLSLGSGEATPIGTVGTAKYVSSYITMAGDLLIVLELTSATSELQIPYDATYLGENGRQVEVSTVDGPGDLAEGRTGNVSYSFAGAKLGGTLELTFNDAEWNEYPITVQTAK